MVENILLELWLLLRHDLINNQLGLFVLKTTSKIFFKVLFSKNSQIYKHGIAGSISNAAGSECSLVHK